MKIMVVDDEDMILDLVGDSLQYAYGYEVVTANGGINAIKVYKEHWNKINCVLLDMMMPEMHGCEVYKFLKEINPNIKVIVMSGYCADEDKKKMTACGCGFIRKPATVHEINDAILQILAR